MTKRALAAAVSQPSLGCLASNKLSCGSGRGRLDELELSGYSQGRCDIHNFRSAVRPICVGLSPTLSKPFERRPYRHSGTSIQRILRLWKAYAWTFLPARAAQKASVTC